VHQIEALIGLSVYIDQAKRAIRGMDDLTGFQVARDHDGLVVHYRHEPGTRVHSVRFESDFDCPAEQLLALAREFDTVKQCVGTP